MKSLNDSRKVLIEGLKTAIFKYIGLFYSVEEDRFVTEEEGQEWVDVNPKKRRKGVYLGMSLVAKRSTLEELSKDWKEMLKTPSVEFLAAQLLAINDLMTKHRDMVVEAFQQRLSRGGPEDAVEELEDWNPESFVLVFKFGIDLGIKVNDGQVDTSVATEDLPKFVTDSYARTLHDVEGYKNAIDAAKEEGRKPGINDLDGIWIYPDLKRYKDPNSALKPADQMSYIVTKQLSWYQRSLPEANRIVTEFRRSQTTTVESGFGAPQIETEPRSRVGSGSLRKNRMAKIQTGGPKLAPAVKDAQTQADLYKMWANNTISKFIEKIRGIKNISEKYARVVQEAMNQEDIYINMHSFRKVKASNNTRIYSRVDASLLEPGKMIGVAVTINKDTIPLIEWQAPNNMNAKKSASNAHLKMFIQTYVAQDLFNAVIREFFSDHIVTDAISSIGEGLDENAMERLQELRPSGGQEDQNEVFGEDLSEFIDVGLSEKMIRSLPMLPEGSIDEAGSMPTITANRELIAVDAMQLNDTEERIRIFNQEFEEYKDEVEAYSTTITRIREDLNSRIVRADVEQDTRGFAVYQPTENRSKEVEFRV